MLLALEKAGSWAVSCREQEKVPGTGNGLWVTASREQSHQAEVPKEVNSSKALGGC